MFLPTPSSKFRNRVRQSLQKRNQIIGPVFEGAEECCYSILHPLGKQDSRITGARCQGHSQLPRQNSRKHISPLSDTAGVPSVIKYR